MVNFKATFTDTNNLKAEFTDSNSMTAEFGETTKVSTSNYEDLFNKPSINGVVLTGNRTSAQIKVQDMMEEITEQDIDNMIFG